MKVMRGLGWFNFWPLEVVASWESAQFYEIREHEDFDDNFVEDCETIGGHPKKLQPS